MIGFLANVAVTKSVDAGSQATIGAAVLINIVLLFLFAVHHSLAARPFLRQ